MADENPYQWTTGGQPDIEHVRKIAASSVGTGVHELHRLTDGVHFARKVVHISQQQDSSPVLNELQAMEKLCTGGHKNLIKVYGWGEFPNATYHFIDMELCDFNLEEYLLCRVKENDDSRVPPECRPTEFGAVQIWDIMRQIAEGVAFIHSYGHVHRDLKPQNVLHSVRDRAWKIADFGLTSEGTSSRDIPTQFSQGSPGYRPPELVNVDAGASYTNKVDVWAMGCILFQLATGSKPFANDHIVLEYSKGNAEIETRCHETIAPQMAKKISDTLQEMLEIKPSARPKSAVLARLFRDHCNSVALQEQIKEIPDDHDSQFGGTGILSNSTETVTDSSASSRMGLVEVFVEKGRKSSESISFLSAATSPPVNLRIFRWTPPYEQQFQVNSKSRSGKKFFDNTQVLFSLANSETSRIVTGCQLWPSSVSILIQLWDAREGSLLWEKEGTSSDEAHWIAKAHPRFSENGKYLAVYDGTWIEILNSHSAQSTGSILAATASDPPKALAVGNNGINLALARNGLENRGIGPGALFEKSPLEEGRFKVDLVSICGLGLVSLCYASEDRLVLAGNLLDVLAYKVVVFFWDTRTGQALNHVVCGREGLLHGSIFPLNKLRVPGKGPSSGVVIPLKDSRVLWNSEFELGDDGGDDANFEAGFQETEDLTTFTTYTSQGEWTGRHICARDKAVIGVVGGEIIILKNRYYLYSWDGSGNTQLRRIGRIDLKSMPMENQIASFALSDDCLTLTIKGTPASLVFLSSNNGAQSKKSEKMGPIVLSKSRTKRKAPGS